MDLLDLKQHLRRAGAKLSLGEDNTLILGAPRSALAPEVIAALKGHRDIFVAYGLRRRKCRWPPEWQIRWGVVANELETLGGLKFPASEIEAYGQVLTEMETTQLPVDRRDGPGGSIPRQAGGLEP